MEWKKFSEKLPEDGQKIIVWQDNISDPECSRHHCAMFYQNEDKSYFIDIYPRVFKTYYRSENNLIDRDLEGDKVQITHWINLPSNPNEYAEHEKNKIINAFLAGQNETGPEAYQKALEFYEKNIKNNPKTAFQLK